MKRHVDIAKRVHDGRKKDDHMGHKYLRECGIKHRVVAGHDKTDPLPDRPHFGQHFGDEVHRLCHLPGFSPIEEDWMPRPGDMLIAWNKNEASDARTFIVAGPVGAPTVTCVCCDGTTKERSLEYDGSWWHIDGRQVRRHVRVAALEAALQDAADRMKAAKEEAAR